MDEDGRASNFEWIEEILGKWKENLARNGVEVNLKRTPAAWSQGIGSKHQESHQRLIVAWADRRGMWQDMVHRHVGKALARLPRSVLTEEQRRRVLRPEDIFEIHWRRRSTSPEYEADLNEVRARVTSVESTLSEERTQEANPRPSAGGERRVRDRRGERGGNDAIAADRELADP